MQHGIFGKYTCTYGFDRSTRYIILIIALNCQHCDEQQFQTLSCVRYTIFSVVKLDLFIRALLLDSILALEKTTRTPRVHLVINEPCNFSSSVTFLSDNPTAAHP